MKPSKVVTLMEYTTIFILGIFIFTLYNQQVIGGIMAIAVMFAFAMMNASISILLQDRVKD